ncbi:MAG: triosephosphate isomerase, partial [Desulfovibrio sp.]|nr:triosephosphate isomerase [Desulfovibrio sp.]
MATIIAANWKMYKVRGEAYETAKALRQALQKGTKQRDVFLFPPFTAVQVVAEALQGVPNLFMGAQNFYPVEEGAFTGEVSLKMIKDCGADWVLVGHSERRHILNESEAFIAQKTKYAIEHGFGVMLC